MRRDHLELPEQAAQKRYQSPTRLNLCGHWSADVRHLADLSVSGDGESRGERNM
jgi:hypothetical protein